MSVAELSPSLPLREPLAKFLFGLRGKRAPSEEIESVLSQVRCHPDMIEGARKLLYGSENITKITDNKLVLRRGNSPERLAFYVLSVLANWDSYLARRKLMTQLEVTEQPYGDIKLDPAAGSMVVKPVEWKLLQTLVTEANESFDTKMSTNTNPGKEMMRAAGVTKPLFESAIFHYARHPAILKIVSDYLGTFPILLRINLLLSLNDRLQENSSQFPHLDPEDFRQLKIFLYINDVDEDTGPYQVVRQDASDRVQLKYNYALGRLTDKQLFDVVKPDELFVCMGPPGTANFSDTSRGFHFGSRPAPKQRKLVMYQYVTAYAASYEIGATAATSKYSEYMKNYLATGKSLSKFDEYLFAVTR